MAYSRLATIPPVDQLQPVDLVTPGARGLNTLQQGSLMDPSYCVTATNAVIDTSARLAARQGPTTLNASVAVTFASAPTTSTALAANWTFATGNYLVVFSTGTTRVVTLTNGSTVTVWATAIGGSPTVNATTVLTVETAITFTAPPTGSSGTLTANWPQVSGLYWINFEDGNLNSNSQIGTFTGGSTAVTWNTAITGTPGARAQVLCPVQSIFEYNQGAGVYLPILAAPGTLASSFTNPGQNSIAGAVTVTNGRWFFQNFNNKLIGFQAGQGPIVWNGAGNAATIVPMAGSSLPTGGVGCAAFGRLWGVNSDLQTIQYSGLLDETNWSNSTPNGNSGIIDMHNIWSDGTDQVTAIFAWNASLVVCGTRHIVFFTDGRGSMLGLDPTQAYVFDVLIGTGCISQWTVAAVGESDILFLSPNGVQSLQRLSTSRNNPLETLTKLNRDLLLGQILAETPANISACFNQLTGYYILGLPSSGTTWCLDTRHNFQDPVDGSLLSPTTTWTMALTACFSFIQNQTLYLARQYQGTVGYYSGYQDEGVNYTFQYLGPWMNLGPQIAQRIKLLKRLELILSTGANTFGASWAVDFGNAVGSTSQAVLQSSTGILSQYGLGQYGISQYGSGGATGSALYIWKYAAHIRGQYFQLGVSCTVGNQFALQQAQLAVKIGRVA